MARDALTDNELMLKKTARRRLVGAITLVVIMLIVLPFILKDRVVENTHTQVEITVVNKQTNKEPIAELPEEENLMATEKSPAVNAATATDPAVASAAEATTPASIASPSGAQSQPQTTQPATELPAPKRPSPAPVATSTPVSTKTSTDPVAPAKPTAPSSKTVTASAKSPETKSPETKVTETKAPESNTPENKAPERKRTASTPATSQPATVTPAPAPNTPPAAAAPTTTASAAVSAPVETPAQPTEAAPPAKEAVAASHSRQAGKFFVQFGVFSEQKNLENLRNKLKQAGIDSTPEKVDAAGQKIRLRSRIYASRHEAAAALKKIQAAGFSGLVASKA